MEIAAYLKTNSPTSKPDSKILQSFRHIALRIVEEASRFVGLRMKAAFDHKFKTEDNGRPRVWTADHKIDKIFEKSREAGRFVLRLFRFCRLREANSNSGLHVSDPFAKILIDDEKANLILMEYDQRIQQEKTSAIESIKAQALNQRIPSWAWFLFIFLGWEKIIAIGSNPFIFMFCMFAGGFYLFLNQFGLQEAFLNAVKEKLITIFEDDEENPNPSAQTGTQPQKEKLE